MRNSCLRLDAPFPCRLRLRERFGCAECVEAVDEGEETGTVTADGAYDTRRCHNAIIDRHATAIIPIRKNARPRKEDCPAAIARNETLRHPPLWPGILEALDGITPCPQPHRGQDALPQGLR